MEMVKRSVTARGVGEGAKKQSSEHFQEKNCKFAYCNDDIDPVGFRSFWFKYICNLFLFELKFSK